MTRKLDKEWLEDICKDIIELSKSIPDFDRNLDLKFCVRVLGFSDYLYDDEKCEYICVMTSEYDVKNTEILGCSRKDVVLNLTKTIIEYEAYNYYGPAHYMDKSDPTHTKIIDGVDPFEIINSRIQYCNEIVEKAIDDMFS